MGHRFLQDGLNSISYCLFSEFIKKKSIFHVFISMLSPGLNATDYDNGITFINVYNHFVHLARKRKFGKKIRLCYNNLDV